MDEDEPGSLPYTRQVWRRNRDSEILELSAMRGATARVYPSSQLCIITDICIQHTAHGLIHMVAGGCHLLPCGCHFISLILMSPSLTRVLMLGL